MNNLPLVLAILALLGWMFTLVVWTKAKLDEANTLAVQVKINKQIDDTIQNVVSKLRPRRPGEAPEVEPLPQRKTVLDDVAEAVRERQRSGEPLKSPFEGNGEMPGMQTVGDIPVTDL